MNKSLYKKTNNVQRCCRKQNKCPIYKKLAKDTNYNYRHRKIFEKECFI